MLSERIKNIPKENRDIYLRKREAPSFESFLQAPKSYKVHVDQYSTSILPHTIPSSNTSIKQQFKSKVHLTNQPVSKDKTEYNRNLCIQNCLPNTNTDTSVDNSSNEVLFSLSSWSSSLKRHTFDNKKAVNLLEDICWGLGEITKVTLNKSLNKVFAGDEVGNLIEWNLTDNKPRKHGK